MSFYFTSGPKDTLTDMMSIPGIAILSEMYSKYRADYLIAFPGSNENDVERNFLHTIYCGMAWKMSEALIEKIEAIR